MGINIYFRMIEHNISDVPVELLLPPLTGVLYLSRAVWKLKGDEAVAWEGCCDDGEGWDGRVGLCMSCMLGVVATGVCEGFREVGVYTTGVLTLDERAGLVVLVSEGRIGEDGFWVGMPHLARKTLR